MKVFLFIMLLTLNISCSNGPESLGPSEYIDFCENPESGLFQSKSFGNIKYSLFYQPTDYQIAKFQGTAYSGNSYDSLKDVKSEMYCFVLKLEATNGATDPFKLDLSNKDEYFERINYFSFEVGNDLSLITGGDTLSCSLVNLERTYNIAPYFNLLVAFDRVDFNEDDLEFVYTDRIFNTGPVHFVISKNFLQKLPQLKTI